MFGSNMIGTGKNDLDYYHILNKVKFDSTTQCHLVHHLGRLKSLNLAILAFTYNN